MKNKRGFSLVELVTVMAIFSVVMLGLYAAYSTQLKHGVAEYRLAESDMELGIAKNMIERDIGMAGYGLADDYDFNNDGAQEFSPRSAQATDASPDTLTIMGTALGLSSRTAQGWTYASDVGAAPTFRTFGDAREDLVIGDRVIVIDPTLRKLAADVTAGNAWKFEYKGTGVNLDATAGGNAFNTPFTGMTLYGLYKDGDAVATQPYYAVHYSLYDPGTARPKICAPNTLNLMRAESSTTATPAGGSPVLNCVLDFQVAFGLDTNDDGKIELWDNGGTTAQGYPLKTLNSRVKQIRVYVLVQAGKQDPAYTHTPSVIRVGDLNLQGGAVGRNITLTAAQLHYRWRMLTIAVTPRNMR